MKMKRVLIGLLASLFASAALANTCTIRQAGATDQSVYVSFVDSTTGVLTAGLAYNTSGIDLEYVRVGAAAVDITEATQTAAGAHSDGGFVSMGHGRYRLDLPDAAVAAGVPEVIVQGVITGYEMLPCSIALSPSVTVASYDSTPGPVAPLGIVDQGTAQSATGTTLVLRSALAMADDTAIGMTLMACGSTQGYCQSRVVTDYVATTDTATVATWTVTPSGTITYYLIATSPTSGGGLDAAATRAALGMSSANLDTQLASLEGYLDTEMAAALAKVNYLPSVAAGAAGGVLIAGTNAATTFTGGITGDINGNVTGSVGTANALAANAITAAATAADFTTEVTAAVATSSALASLVTTVGVAGAGLTAADDAVMTRLGAPTGASVSADVAAVKADTAALVTATDTEIAAIKAKTDQMTFGVTNQLNVNVESQNAVEVLGAGTAGDKFRGAP